MTLIRWGAPGPYVVAFTTRLGGVSTGPFESLNLGARGDDPARVAENRRIACDAIGLDAENLSVNRQRHSPHAFIAPSPAFATSPATRSGPTSPACRCSR